MPGTITTTTTLAPSWTQTNIFGAIKSAMSTAGYPTPHDEFTGAGGDLNVVYEIVFDNTKTYGKFYVWIQVSTSNTVFNSVAIDWDITTHNTTHYVFRSQSVSNANPVTIRAISHTELRGVSVDNSATHFFCGYFRPTNKPTWWNEGTYIYAFAINEDDLRDNLAPTGTYSPYNHASTARYSVLAPSGQQLASPSAKRDVLRGVVMLAPSGTGMGYAGRTSDDFALVASSGTNRYDQLEVSATEIYTIIDVNTGFSLRTT